MAFAFKNLPAAARDDLRVDVLTGLAAIPKSIPPKYFYDEQGCRLFEAICAQPEYALCRTEQALMGSRVADIATAIGPVACIVEPGAGDCVKVRLLLDALRPSHLVVLLIRPDLSVIHAAYLTRASWKNFFTRSGDFSNNCMCSVAAAFNLALVRTGTLV